MAGSARITDESAFESGSLGKQVLFTVVTLGVYWLYWTYKTGKMLNEGTDQSLIPILGVVPVLNFVAFWQIANAAEAVTDKSPVVVFVLFFFLPFASWYWIQSGINAVASN